MGCLNEIAGVSRILPFTRSEYTLLERFGASWDRESATSLCYCAIPDEKQASAYPGIVLAVGLGALVSALPIGAVAYDRAGGRLGIAVPWN